jgi:hypothetical protein
MSKVEALCTESIISPSTLTQDPVSSLSMPAPDFTPEEKTVFDDFRVSIGRVFQHLYDEKWDEELWHKAIGRLLCFIE